MVRSAWLAVAAEGNVLGMIRTSSHAIAAALAAAFLTVPAFAQQQRPAQPAPSPAPAQRAQPAPARPAAQPANRAPAAANAVRPGQAVPAKPAAGGAGMGQATAVETTGSWGAYVGGQGASRYCYAASQPTGRAPDTLKRDDGYIFVTNRPAEKVKGEVALVLGFPTRDTAPAKATIGERSFDIVTKDGKAWLRNPAEEPQFIQALVGGAELKVAVTSGRGNASTDTFSLSGFTKSWERTQKECP